MEREKMRKMSKIGFVLIFMVMIASPSYAEWAMTYNNEWFSEFPKSIQQTADGGYVVVGETLAHDLNLNTEIWVLKLKGNGSIEWSKSYGVPGEACCSAEHGYSIQQTKDGGYIVAGYTQAAGNHPWILKLYQDGNIEWQKTYNWTFGNDIFSIKQTKDGGYTMAGLFISAFDGLTDFWVVKLNPDGTIDWQKAYGGGRREVAYSIEQTEDEGYIVAGVTESFGAGDQDVWVLKLNPNGSIAWQKTYGGPESEVVNDFETPTWRI